MVKMANYAEDHPADIMSAVVYLIMVIQFIAMIIYYYKRAFIISFLIVIYPFVALSYIVDTMGDGKAQALNTWMKEFTTNVFVQLVHAVVYVFVISATMSGLSAGDNWLLAIVGITFLFKGEQILKAIFQLGGSSARSLADTSRRTIATVLATRAVGSAVANTAKYGLSTIRTFNRFRTEKKISENDALFISDTTTRKSDNSTSNNTAINGISTHITNNNGASDRREAELNNPELVQAINTVNSIDSIKDPQKLADALKVLQNNKDSLDPQVQELLKSSNLSSSQVANINNLEQNVSRLILKASKSSGKDIVKLKQRVEEELDIGLEHTLPASTAYERAMMKVAILRNVSNTSEAMMAISRETGESRRAIRGINSSFTSGEIRGGISGSIDTEELGIRGAFNPNIVNQEINYKRRAIDNFFNPLRESKKKKKKIKSGKSRRKDSPFAIAPKNIALSRFANKDANRVMQSRLGTNARAATKMQRKFASSIAIMHEFGAQSGRDKVNTSPTKYTMRQVKSAADFLKQVEKEEPEMKRIIASEFTYKGDDGETTQLSGRDLSSIVNESILRFHSKDPDGSIKNSFGGFDEDVTIETIRISRAITDVEKRFFNPETINNKNKIPFEVTKHEIPLSEDATMSRNRMLNQHFGKTLSNATDDEISLCTNLAMIKEYSASSKTLEERQNNEYVKEFKESEVTSYSLEQLQEAFAGLELAELNEKERNIISKEIPVTAKKANDYFSNEVKRAYQDSDDELKSKIKSIYGLDAELPLEGELSGSEPTKFERDVAIDSARKVFEEVIKERLDDTRKIADDGVSSDSITGITADDVFRLDEQIERNVLSDTNYMADSTEGERYTFAYAESVASARAKSVNNIADDIIKGKYQNGELDENNLNYLDKLATEMATQIDPTVPKYDGLTQDEHKKKAEVLRKRAIQELSQTAIQTTGVVLSGTIGAAMGVGIGDDSSMLHEALVGAATGMHIGDVATDIAMGTDETSTKTKKVKIISPYSGEIEEFELKYQGVGSNIKIFNGGTSVDIDIKVFNSINENEVLYLDDPRLRKLNKFEIEDQLLDLHKERQKAKTKKNILKYSNALANSKKIK